ncbi:hypothetical protein TWF694_010510 [Orbilia ellipsospora]|uniref:Peptidase S8/S53 domain-containing protein n=1 Tax=Orbilia ellipsospora TaxID=2528407 RepID=A0AAV9XB92_9PEZI
MPNDEKSDDDLPVGEYNPDDEENPIFSHGTSVAGKLLGNKFGVAPWADLVAVKKQDGRFLFTIFNDIDFLLKIYDHLLRSRNKYSDIKGAVIVYAYGFEVNFPHNRFFLQAYEDLYIEILQKLGEKGAYFLIPTGNESPSTKIAHYPQILISENLSGRRGGKRLTNTMLVGGIDTRTGENLYQLNPEVKIFAPADEVSVPIGSSQYRGSEGNVGAVSGTSYAAPLVAGLLATFMGLGEMDPVLKVESLAYPRINGGPPVLWNGITRSMWGTAQSQNRGSGGSKKRPSNEEPDEACDFERAKKKLCSSKPRN